MKREYTQAYQNFCFNNGRSSWLKRGYWFFDFFRSDDIDLDVLHNEIKLNNEVANVN